MIPYVILRKIIGMRLLNAVVLYTLALLDRYTDPLELGKFN